MIQRLSALETAWDPFGEITEFRRAMNRLLRPGDGLSQAYPPLNIYANDEEVVVSAEVPGFDKESLDISVHGSTFSLSGSREPVEVGEEATYLREERFQGRFNRMVDLPFSVDAERVKAQLRNGTLVCHLPRAESDKPRKITIGAK
jgi:HSP20 family protein